MSESFIEITAGSGTKLHAAAETVGANAILRQKVILGQPDYPSYSVIASNIDVATANAHLLVLMADGTNHCRITRIRLQQAAVANADTVLEVAIVRVSTAGTGGSAVTPSPHDAADGAYGGDAFTQPTAKGTEGATIDEIWLPLDDGHPFGEPRDWTPAPFAKPLKIGTAATDGVAIKNVGSDSAGDVTATIDFILTTY